MSQPKRKKYLKARRRSPRWQSLLLALGGLGLVLVAFFALRQDAVAPAEIEVSGAPSLQADQERIDLGEIKVDQPAHASFNLTNVGDETLRFTKAPYIEVVEGC